MSTSFIFLVKSFLGNFYRHFAIFTGHTDDDSCSLMSLPKRRPTILYFIVYYLHWTMCLQVSIVTSCELCRRCQLPWTKQLITEEKQSWLHWVVENAKTHLGKTQSIYKVLAVWSPHYIEWNINQTCMYLGRYTMIAYSRHRGMRTKERWKGYVTRFGKISPLG